MSILILLLALASRFALLDSQAMHHDEGIHALWGWQIYQGQGYVHDAVYHGPFIYHAGALAFSLFGDSDVTARLMPALFSVATVLLPLLLRRQLGRWGALLASFLLLISPSFLYFGRFVRNDVFGAFWTLLLFVCIVRYLADRRDGWLYGVAVVTSLYFCTKETSYITVAVFALFLLGRLLWKRFGLHALWPLLGLVPAAVEDFLQRLQPQEMVPLTLDSAEAAASTGLSLSWFSLLPLALAGLAIAAMLAWCWWESRGRKRSNPTLDLVVLLGTLVLPLLSAIPLNLLVRLRGMAEIDYHSPNIPPEVIILAVIAIGFTFVVAAAIGLPWDRRRWLVANGAFWGIFFVLHTSFFTSMTGWATGMVQALGFWLSQQGVKRIHVGPQYYLILMPVYELVSVVFGLLGLGVFAWRALLHGARTPQGAPDLRVDGTALAEVSTAAGETALERPEPPALPPPPLGAGSGVALGMLAWWALVGFAVYSLAGEQVPWLNVHPTLPFLLLAAALMGRVFSYRARREASALRRRWADLSLLVVGGGLLLWAGWPFLQETLPAENLAISGTMAQFLRGAVWLLVAAMMLGAAYLALQAVRPERRGHVALAGLGIVAAGMVWIGACVLSYQERYPEWWQLYVPLGLVALALVLRAALLGKAALRSSALVLFGLLCAYSISSAWRVAYITNDTPVEALVYVQTSSDAQWAMDQLSTLSTLTTGGDDLVFLYDSEVAWPMEWYFRNYQRKSYQATISGPPAEEAAMALVYRDQDDTSGPYLERRFDPTRFYAFNWWFPEDTYRTARTFVQRVAPELLSETMQEDPNWKTVLRSLVHPGGQARIWRYFLYREPLSPLGAREFALYLRRDLVAPMALLKKTIPPR